MLRLYVSLENAFVKFPEMVLDCKRYCVPLEFPFALQVTVTLLLQTELYVGETTPGV